MKRRSDGFFPMRAGALQHRVTIERYVETRDDFNNPVPSWTELTKVWASWRPASARERLAAQEIAAEMSDVFEIRWSETVRDVNPKDRLVHDGRVYNITRVHEIPRRRGLHIEASARAD